MGFRKPDRLVLRPVAQWWGSDWQRVTYTRMVIVPISRTAPTQISSDQFKIRMKKRKK